jgi:hypothetical protein
VPVLITVMRGVMHCGLVGVLWHFRRICLYHRSQCILPYCDDGCSGFLWNVDLCPSDSMVSHPRRRLPSSGKMFHILQYSQIQMHSWLYKIWLSLILVRIKITVFWDWFCVIENVGTVSTIPHGIMAKNYGVLNHSLMFYFWLTLVLPGCTVVKHWYCFKKMYIYDTKQK